MKIVLEIIPRFRDRNSNGYRTHVAFCHLNYEIYPNKANLCARESFLLSKGLAKFIFKHKLRLKSITEEKVLQKKKYYRRKSITEEKVLQKKNDRWQQTGHFVRKQNYDW